MGYNSTSRSNRDRSPIFRSNRDRDRSPISQRSPRNRGDRREHKWEVADRGDRRRADERNRSGDNRRPGVNGRLSTGRQANPTGKFVASDTLKTELRDLRLALSKEESFGKKAARLEKLLWKLSSHLEQGHVVHHFRSQVKKDVASKVLIEVIGLIEKKRRAGKNINQVYKAIFDNFWEHSKEVLFKSVYGELLADVWSPLEFSKKLKWASHGLIPAILLTWGCGQNDRKGIQAWIHQFPDLTKSDSGMESKDTPSKMGDVAGVPKSDGEVTAEAGEVTAEAMEVNAEAGEVNAEAGEVNAETGEVNAEAATTVSDCTNGVVDASTVSDSHVEDVSNRSAKDEVTGVVSVEEADEDVVCGVAEPDATPVSDRVVDVAVDASTVSDSNVVNVSNGSDQVTVVRVKDANEDAASVEVMDVDASPSSENETDIFALAKKRTSLRDACVDVFESFLPLSPLDRAKKLREAFNVQFKDSPFFKPEHFSDSLICRRVKFIKDKDWEAVPAYREAKWRGEIDHLIGFIGDIQPAEFLELCDDRVGTAVDVDVVKRKILEATLVTLPSAAVALNERWGVTDLTELVNAAAASDSRPFVGRPCNDNEALHALVPTEDVLWVRDAGDVDLARKLLDEESLVVVRSRLEKESRCRITLALSSANKFLAFEMNPDEELTQKFVTDVLSLLATKRVVFADDSSIKLVESKLPKTEIEVLKPLFTTFPQMIDHVEGVVLTVVELAERLTNGDLCSAYGLDPKGLKPSVERLCHEAHVPAMILQMVKDDPQYVADEVFVAYRNKTQANSNAAQPSKKKKRSSVGSSKSSNNRGYQNNDRNRRFGNAGNNVANGQKSPAAKKVARAASWKKKEVASPAKPGYKGTNVQKKEAIECIQID